MKSYARVERWKEEVQLLAEEMRRVVAFLDWRRLWWLSQADKRREVAKELEEDLPSGLEAYAKQQADCYDCLTTSFARKWVDLLRRSEPPSSWCDQYVLPISNGEHGSLMRSPWKRLTRSYAMFPALTIHPPPTLAKPTNNRLNSKRV